MFANPRSGDQAAAKFIHPDFDTFQVQFSEKEVSLFNIRFRGQVPNTPGLAEETKDADSADPVRALCFIFNVTEKKGREKCDKKL